MAGRAPEAEESADPSKVQEGKGGVAHQLPRWNIRARVVRGSLSFWRRFELCWLVLDKDGQAGRVCTRNTTSNLSGKHETQSEDKESA